MGLAEKHHHCRNLEVQPKGHPKVLMPVLDREERPVMHVYNTKEKILLDSYIDKRKNGKENVIVLSNMHDNVKIMKEHRKKHRVHTMYDHTKVSVDVVDLLSTTHSTQIKSRRWSFNALAFIHDTCRSNVKTIFKIMVSN